MKQTLTNSTMSYTVAVERDNHVMVVNCPWCDTRHALNSVSAGLREITIDHSPTLCLAWVDGELMKGPFG